MPVQIFMVGWNDQFVETCAEAGADSPCILQIGILEYPMTIRPVQLDVDHLHKMLVHGSPRYHPTLLKNHADRNQNGSHQNGDFQHLHPGCIGCLTFGLMRHHRFNVFQGRTSEQMSLKRSCAPGCWQGTASQSGGVASRLVLAREIKLT